MDPDQDRDVQFVKDIMLGLALLTICAIQPAAAFQGVPQLGTTARATPTHQASSSAMSMNLGSKTLSNDPQTITR